MQSGPGDDPHGIADLDPNDPKYKRRIQNRMASARFRAKAKERQNELDRLKNQGGAVQVECSLPIACKSLVSTLEPEMCYPGFNPLLPNATCTATPSHAAAAREG
jgi:hypothetical protein